MSAQTGWTGCGQSESSTCVFSAMRTGQCAEGLVANPEGYEGDIVIVKLFFGLSLESDPAAVVLVHPCLAGDEREQS